MTQFAEKGRVLLSHLERTRAAVESYDESRFDQHWQFSALKTTIDNISAYYLELSNALSAGSDADTRKAACRASGLRKGVSDMSIFDPEKDKSIIRLIDEASDTAWDICLS